MEICLEIKRLTLPHSEVKSFAGLLRLASALYQRSQNSIKLFFYQGDIQTEIQSDDDLMALKYMIKQSNITFKVQLSKSKHEIENELLGEVVDRFLDQTYDEVVEEEFMREIKENVSFFLDVMYKSISKKHAKEETKKIRNDTVSAYLKNMNEEIISSFTLPKRLPIYKRTNRVIRVSPQKELYQRKESQVESMVSRILESMMPVMVKELSYRIIEELKSSHDSWREYDLNPEQL